MHHREQMSTPVFKLILLTVGALCPIVHRMAKNKSEDIKVRVDPLTKSVLVQIADAELLDLSDVVRRALHDFVQKKTRVEKEPQPQYAHP